MRRNYHNYTEEQLEYIREIGPTRTNKEITELFNAKFNLNQSMRKISEYRRKHNIPSKYSNAQELNEDGTFKKGRVSWNKGKKGYMGANATSFKKGEFPPNRVPIGSKRITKDNYIQIKIQDGKNQQNWRGKHILIWEKENGPLPEGHAIIFGDKNDRNFDISNLICVSRKQLLGLNRHDLIQDDAELTRTAVKIVDLEYKINELSQEV